MKNLFPPLQYFNVPNLITSAAIVMGLLCPLFIHLGYEKLPAIFFLLALGLDYADGIVARKLGQSSAFGENIDSLADAINFCAVPAIVAWGLGMRSATELALLLFFVLAGIWRLTYYNVHGLESEDDPKFTGIPTTVAAAYFLVLVCVVQILGIEFRTVAIPYIVIATILMVSAVPLRKRGPIIPATGLISTVSVVAYLFV